MHIYIGDSARPQSRILGHCSPNVEGSAFRKSVAASMGYDFNRELLPNRRVRIRIALPEPALGEENVSNYIRTGFWRFVICENSFEAKNFQWYAIQQLQPLLNINQGHWNQDNLILYKEML